METDKEWEERILARTGKSPREIKLAEDEEMILEATIVALRRLDKYTKEIIAYVGYPDHEDEDGPVWAEESLRRFFLVPMDEAAKMLAENPPEE